MSAKTWGIAILARVFSALLPSDDNSSSKDDYYKVLGVSRNASQDEIKRAYKKKSLELHPDKVAQRGHMDAEEAAALYEVVQEAYSVLGDKKKRKLYDALQCNTAQYEFISQHLHYNPSAVYQNLASASLWARTRLVLVMALVLMVALCQPILISAKVNQDLSNNGALADTPWTVVLIPWWIMHISYIMLWGVIWILATENRYLVFVIWMEQVSWLIWVVFLALRWDQTVAWDYAVVFIPSYIAIVLRIHETVLRMRQTSNAVSKMVSISYLEQHVLQNGRRYEDLNEAEQEALQEDYIIVHESADDVDLSDLGLSEDDLEEARVHSSPEFQHAMEVYYNALTKFVNCVLFWPPTFILIVLRLDNHITVSWWVVFLPVWIHLGLKLLSDCYVCCCAAVSGHEVIVSSGAMDMPDDINNNSNSNTQERDLRSNEDKVESMRNMADKAEETETMQSSTFFAPAEGNIRESTNTDTQSTKVEKDDAELQSPTDTSSHQQQADGNQHRDVSKSDDQEPAAAAPDVVELYSPDDAMQSPKPTVHAAEEVEQEDDEEEIDPEMFAEWQRAHQEADESAVEAQAKAQGDFCLVSLELMILCLLVGKLDQSYQQPEGADTGYSAIWIIFPLLLIAGMMLCCCACLVYGANPRTEMTANTATTADATAPQQQEDSSPPIVVPPPPSPPTATERKDEEFQDEPQKGKEETKDEEVAADTFDPNDID